METAVKDHQSTRGDVSQVYPATIYFSMPLGSQGRWVLNTRHTTSYVSVQAQRQTGMQTSSLAQCSHQLFWSIYTLNLLAGKTRYWQESIQ